MIEIIKAEKKVKDIKKGMFLISDDDEEVIFTTENEHKGLVKCIVIWSSSNSPYEVGDIEEFILGRFNIFEGSIKIKY